MFINSDKLKYISFTMEPLPPTLQSVINVNFGTETNPNKPTPIDIESKVYFFQNINKLDNIKFNLSQFMKRQISNDTIVIEVQSKKGDNQALAMKIQQQTKNSIQSLLKQGTLKQFKIYAPSNTNKLYMLFQGGNIGILNKQLSKEIYEQQQQLKTEDLCIKIKSQNNWENVRNIAAEKNSIIKAMLDNLSICLSFTSSQVVKQMLLMALNKKNQAGARALVYGFSHLNMNLKMQSSQALERFEKWRNFKQNPNWTNVQKGELTFYESFKGEFQEKAKIYWFGYPMSLQGNIHLSGFEILMKMINCLVQQ